MWAGTVSYEFGRRFDLHVDELREAAAVAAVRAEALARLREERLRRDGVAFFGMHAQQSIVRFGMTGFGRAVCLARSSPPPKFGTYQGDF